MAFKDLFKKLVSKKRPVTLESELESSKLKLLQDISKFVNGEYSDSMFSFSRYKSDYGKQFSVYLIRGMEVEFRLLRKEIEKIYPGRSSLIELPRIYMGSYIGTTVRGIEFYSPSEALSCKFKLDSYENSVMRGVELFEDGLVDSISETMKVISPLKEESYDQLEKKLAESTIFRVHNLGYSDDDLYCDVAKDATPEHIQQILTVFLNPNILHYKTKNPIAGIEREIEVMEPLILGNLFRNLFKW